MAINKKIDRSKDSIYLGIIQEAINKCREYRPKFGLEGKAGQTIESFTTAYGQDPFYHWLGLDSPLVYAAHRAAGGITSVYRQIGIACQWVFSRILQDSLGLTVQDSSWNYTVPSAVKGIDRKLSLDGRIPLASLTNKSQIERIVKWLDQAAQIVALDKSARKRMQGAVFEVRQGYKSADSKRQNADIANAANAYARGYLPVVLLFSSQIPQGIAERYAKAQWLMLRGTLSGCPTDSTYAFCRDVLGYDLAGFFERNSNQIRFHVEAVLRDLLQ